MVRIQSETWALVADGAKARVFKLGAKMGEIEEIERLHSAEAGMPSRELVSDAGSRVRHAAGFPGSHTKQAKSDAHDMAAKKFAVSLMQRMEKAAGRNDFRQLVVVADPHTLGYFRQNMPKKVAARVSRELNADLTWMPAERIDRRVRASFELR